MNRIKYLREKNNMTQEKLGELIGVQSSAISKYEKEIVPLTDDTIKKLAAIFNVSTDYILDNTPPKNEEEELYSLKWLLIEKGFMKNEKDLSNKEVNKLIEFVGKNKDLFKDYK